MTRLFKGQAAAGVHHLDWNARTSSGGAGVYFVRLETSGKSLVQRVVLVTN